MTTTRRIKKEKKYLDGTREGRICKEIRLTAGEGWMSGGGRCIIGYVVDTYEENIEVYFLKGGCPYWRDLLDILVSDRDIRRLMKRYALKESVTPFKLFRTVGQTGREDFFITRGQEYGPFAVTRTKHLLHISMCEKLNEGFGETGKMDIADFTELAAYLGYTKDMTAKMLRKRSGAKYILPRLSKEIEGFKGSPSSIV